MANVLIRKENINLLTDSVAKEITVYSNKAQVKRTKTVSLQEGENIVVFSNLGNDIDDQSIKSGLLCKGAKIVSASLQRNYLYFYKETESEKLYQSVLECLRNIIELLDKKSIYALENHVTLDLRDYIRELLNDILITQENSIPKLSEALQFLEKQMELNSHHIITINEEIDELRENYEIVSEKLMKLRELDKRIQNNIEVVIFSEEQGTVEVEISYILPRFQWRSSYDAKLNTKTKKVEFLYYGEIKQSSGEELKDVKVILSTSETETLVEIPEIYPVYLSGYEEKRKHQLMVEEEIVRDLVEEEGEADEEPKETTTYDQVPGGSEPEKNVDVRKKGAAHTFTVDKPCAIPSDNEWHRFLICRTEDDSVLSYETIPEYLEYVYLKATQKNTTGIPFLKGKIAVYRNESYMGLSALEYTALDEEYSLSFGVDEDVRVKRIQFKNLSKPAKGLVGRHFREWEYHYIFYNYKKEQVTVVLKEGVYVSELKEVTVKICENTSPGYTMSKEGIMEWAVAIPPDPFKQVKMVLHYELTAPKSFSLSSL